MKRKWLSLLGGLSFALLLTGCDVDEMSTLKDLSRPYVGEYRCKRLELGGEDVLKEYKAVKLDLGQDGSYRLFYRRADGGTGEHSGTYSMKEERIRLTSAGSSYEFPYQNGAVRIESLFAGKLLYAEFSMTD